RVMVSAVALLSACLVIGSVTTPELPPDPPPVPHLAVVGDALVAPATYTLDASSTDRWRRFDFRRGGVVDSGGWDIAFRRFHLITAPGGGIVDLGAVPFDSVRELPPGGYLGNTNAPDTTNPGVGKWYGY